MDFNNLPVTEESWPQLMEEDFSTHPLRYRRMRLSILSMFFIPLMAGSIALFWAPSVLLAGLVLAFVLLCYFFGVFAELRGFPLRGYLIRTHDISYRKGWIFRSKVSVPYNRIQHSEVSQGPLERLMKLSTLKIFTAGGSTSDLSIGGLEPDEAQRLREWVTDRTARHV